MTYGVSSHQNESHCQSDQDDINIDELYKQFIEQREEIEREREVQNIMQEIRQMILDTIEMLKDVEMFKQLMLLILSEQFVNVMLCEQ